MSSDRRLGIMLAVAAGILSLAAACGRWGGAECPQCGRVECKNMSFSVRLSDGTETKTCCPRCALRYLREKQPSVASMAVRDFNTASLLDASTALYVEGSDVHPCAMHESSSPVDERGCCLKPVYDRCEPSLVAFASASKAEAFAREHGGFLRTFRQLEAAVH